MRDQPRPKAGNAAVTVVLARISAPCAMSTLHTSGPPCLAQWCKAVQRRCVRAASGAVGASATRVAPSDQGSAYRKRVHARCPPGCVRRTRAAAVSARPRASVRRWRTPHIGAVCQQLLRHGPAVDQRGAHERREARLVRLVHLAAVAQRSLCSGEVTLRRCSMQRPFVVARHGAHCSARSAHALGGGARTRVADVAASSPAPSRRMDCTTAPSWKTTSDVVCCATLRCMTRPA